MVELECENWNLKKKKNLEILIYWIFFIICLLEIVILKVIKIIRLDLLNIIGWCFLKDVFSEFKGLKE